jgi:hypothetical protein
MGCDIPMNSVLFQQDCARPQTGNIALCIHHNVSKSRVLPNWYLALFEERIFMATNLTRLITLQLFSVGVYFKEGIGCFRKIPTIF